MEGCIEMGKPRRETIPRELWALSVDRMEIREYEMPEPEEGQVRVLSQYAAAKHGTEQSMVKGSGAKRGRYDRALRIFRPKQPRHKRDAVRVGNMVVGTVTAVGAGVKELGEGDRVLAHAPFREVHVLAEDRCWRMPDGLSWKSGVCLDPADFAMGAVRDGNVRIGDAVAVFGMGAIGLMVVQVAKLSGAYPVIAVDPLANRRQAAVACGADAVFDPSECDAGIEIKMATGGRGVDIAIEYSGNVHALRDAIRAVSFGGNVVAGAAPAPYGAGLDFGAEAHLHIPNIIFSRACSEPNREYPRWDENRLFDTCLRLLAEGKLSGEAIVSPIVPFEELVIEYPKIASDPGSNIKLGATF